MNRLTGLAALMCLAAMLQGCGSSSGLVDKLGMGKSSPDETQIRTTQSLSMPPDMRLPPPGQTVAEDGQLASVTASNAMSAPPPDATVNATAAADGNVNVASAEPAPAIQSPAAPAPVTTTMTDDIYARYGISRTKPDGTAKTEDELIKELRAAKLAEKRRSNPNYGTIFNMGDLFKDG